MKKPDPQICIVKQAITLQIFKLMQHNYLSILRTASCLWLVTSPYLCLHDNRNKQETIY